jgi:hypothetical protein
MLSVVLSLNLDDLKVSKEEQSKIDPISVISDTIENILLGLASANKGFTEKERRTYYKIMDIFEEAISTKNTTVTFNDDQEVLLKKAFTENKLIPNKLLRQIETMFSIEKVE